MGSFLEYGSVRGAARKGGPYRDQSDRGLSELDCGT
jgi:hypothetical protein